MTKASILASDFIRIPLYSVKQDCTCEKKPIVMTYEKRKQININVFSLSAFPFDLSYPAGDLDNFSGF